MSDEWHESESYLQLSRTQAQFVARSERASERASHACCTHAAVVARAHSIERRSRGFFRADTRRSSCTALGSNTRPVLYSSLGRSVQIVLPLSGRSRLWVGGGGGGVGREIAESLTGVEHDPKCGFMAFQRSRLWEGDLQNP